MTRKTVEAKWVAVDTTSLVKFLVGIATDLFVMDYDLYEITCGECGGDFRVRRTASKQYAKCKICGTMNTWHGVDEECKL